MLKWLHNLVGETNEKEMKRLEPIVQRVNELEPEMQSCSDEELRGKTAEFLARYQQGESLDEMLPEAFAVVREASRRTTGMRHFDVQIMGGAALHQGKIAEMRTGEGKTLVATLPLYLNALTGKGAHLVTVNDYLAKRDAQWMGPIYDILGLSVGIIQHESAFLFDPKHHSPDPRVQFLRPVPHRREAYHADITYGTNNEFGFDYLRDNMVNDLNQCVQRELNYAIVDEVDNILIDEARTPLIISGQAEESADKYYLFARLVPRMREEEDFKIDEKVRAITLTEVGIAKMERWLGVENLYDPANYDLTHYLDQAMRAQFIYKLERDYVIYMDGKVINHPAPDAEIVIVDEFTGRLMLGRRYSEGLHQAIEAKEGVRIQRESVTMATITFQNYFRLYKKLAGMTGTAYTEREEFLKIYNLDVLMIPTHKTMVRADHQDQILKNEDAKFKAIVQEIEEMHEDGRPVLVGTVFIEKSEHLSNLLRREGIEHNVLNAKYHEREAGIIAQAGRPGGVTIATNMAGRGVDILLGGNPKGLVEDYLKKRGLKLETATPEQMADALAEAERDCAADREKVLAAGGLHIVGTERHEARRIDNQLRGRAGRQGDPGSSRFFVSLQDDLMRRFGGTGVANLMDKIMEDGVPIEHSWVSKAIENAQTKVEGHNFDIRKHIVQYDDVMNKQREVIYAERHKILDQEDLRSAIMKMVQDELTGLVDAHCVGEHSEEWDLEGLMPMVTSIVPLPEDATPESLASFMRDELKQYLLDVAEAKYQEKEEELGREQMAQLERLVMLHIIDRLWVEHLTAIDDLREGIGLRAYGQRDPLIEYKNEAFGMFQNLLATIQHDIVHMIYHVSIQREAPKRPTPMKNIATNRNDDKPREPVKAGHKIGRNDPCPCGSGKKYKKCHGRGQ